MSAESNTTSSAAEEIDRLLKDAPEGVQKVLNEVTKIERAALDQKHRNKSGMSKQIVDAVKRQIT